MGLFLITVILAVAGGTAFVLGSRQFEPSVTMWGMSAARAWWTIAVGFWAVDVVVLLVAPVFTEH